MSNQRFSGPTPPPPPVVSNVERGVGREEVEVGDWVVNYISMEKVARLDAHPSVYSLSMCMGKVLKIEGGRITYAITGPDSRSWEICFEQNLKAKIVAGVLREMADKLEEL